MPRKDRLYCVPPSISMQFQDNNVDVETRAPILDERALRIEIAEEDEKIRSLQSSMHNAEKLKRELENAKSVGLELDERLRQAELEWEEAELEQNKAFHEEDLLLDEIGKLETQLEIARRDEVSFEWNGEQSQLETDFGSKDKIPSYSVVNVEGEGYRTP